MRLAAAAFILMMVSAAASAAERWETVPEPPPMPPPAKSGFAPVNGIRMYYATYGEGAPILLIHGGLAHADVWANQIAPLVSAGHKVIVADSRGHGRSTRTDAPFGYDLMASDYVRLLDYLKLPRVALVGWSDGGIIGLDIAMHHPERLTKLFAQAANATVDAVTSNLDQDPAFGGFIRRMREDYLRLQRSGVLDEAQAGDQARLVFASSAGQPAAAGTASDYDAFVEQIGRMWATEPNWTREQLAAIRVPTAIVIGDHDEAISLAHTEYMAATIPGARLIILPGVSHFAMLQDPDGYTKAILSFIDGK